MGEVELVNAIRSAAVQAVRAREKPVSVQIGTYNGGTKVVIAGDLEIDATIPKSVGEINPGDNVLVLKQDGENIYFVVAVI